MKYRLLEPLRGIAALWVFSFHFTSSEAWNQTFPYLRVLARIGDLGVPMFFVISGYCISAAARNAIQYNQTTRYFLYRRVRRIYPPYWFSILIVASLPFLIEALSAVKTGHYVPPDHQNPNYGFLNYSWFDWLRVTSLTQVFAHVSGADSLQYKFTAINAVYWTLAIEVQFYFVVGCALLMRRRFYELLALVTLVSLPLAFLKGAYVIGIFLPYWPMFAVGVVVYVLFERGLSPSKLLGPSAVWWSAGLVTSAGVLFFVYAAMRLPITPLAFTVCLGCVLYAAEGLDDSYGRAIKSRARWIRHPAQLMVALGAMSYSLYLLHGRIQFLSLQASRQLFARNSIAHDVVAIGLTLMLCYLFYLACERPFAGSARVRTDQPGAIAR